MKDVLADMPVRCLALIAVLWQGTYMQEGSSCRLQRWGASRWPVRAPD